MKILVTLVLTVFTTLACSKEEPKKVDLKVTDSVAVSKKVDLKVTDSVAVPKTDNCVKKNKAGKCPPPPKSPKPTPKKKIEKP